MDRWTPVPKIAAALLAAIVIIVIVAVAPLVGIDLAVEGRAALVVIVAALGPVVAGYIKDG